MMDKRIIKRVMQENQEEIPGYQVLPRLDRINEDANYVLVGVRRSGKSFMMYQKIQECLRKGDDWSQMLYVNFEDERLIGMQSDDLNLILEAHFERYEKRPTLFLDEIQNVVGWEKFVRRLADQKYRVYVTGSNAQMLSNEIYSTLGGRFLVKEIYPFQFSEFCDACGCHYEDLDALSTIRRSALLRTFETYFRHGGFPEAATMLAKKNYLLSAYQKIYLGDIAARNNISNTLGLKMMLKKLAESVGQPISYNRISAITASSGCKLSVTSVSKYVDYCINAWLILRITNIASSLAERESNPKYYYIDNGILSLLTLDADSALLENLVAIRLIHIYGHENSVYFYHHNIEVDFYIPEEQWAIQVTMTLCDPETRRRELNALVKLQKVLSCKRMTILTYDEEETIQTDVGIIEVMPVWKWLLS